MAPTKHTTKQKKELVVQAIDFSLIARHLYKMGLDEHERQRILTEAHGGVKGENYVGKPLRKIF